jgi:hypothetical protein
VYRQRICGALGPWVQPEKYFFRTVSVSQMRQILLAKTEQSKVFIEYLLSFYAQHVPLFLSIMLNWSNEGNLPQHYIESHGYLQL